MAGGKEKSESNTEKKITVPSNRDGVIYIQFTVTPFFYEEVQRYNRANAQFESEKKLLQQKYVYFLDNSRQGIPQELKAGDDGKLYSSETDPYPFHLGQHSFYVSKNRMDNMSPVETNLYSAGVMNSTVSEIILKNLFESSKIIGTYTGGKKEMIVWQYGRFNTKRAIFLIGGIHGNEEGGINAIKIMEEYVRQTPWALPPDVTVYVLNPASITGEQRGLSDDEKRNINGIDPNRDFIQQRLNETRAIADFTNYLADYHGAVTIISAHRYHDYGSGKGYVFPLYKLTEEGKKIVVKYKDADSIHLTFNTHYVNPVVSNNLAIKFADYTGFTYQTMWEKNGKAEMYRGEYLNFVSNLTGNINLVEFEIPKSQELTVDKWKGAFINFVQECFKE